MRFRNKNVLITGASRGIGEAAAMAFAQEGANLLLNYFVSDYESDAFENISRIKNLLEGKGVKIEIFEADISNPLKLAEMLNFAKENFEHIDIVINNAGYVVDKNINERTVEDWNRAIGVNLTGQYLVIKYFSEILNENGRVLNLTSTNGINTQYTGSIDYDAAKAGVISVTKNFAIELSPKNITVNAIAPGWVNTKMNEQLPEDFIKSETDKILLKRFADLSDVVKPILFLASEDAGYITGSVLVVDGGMKLI